MHRFIAGLAGAALLAMASVAASGFEQQAAAVADEDAWCEDVGSNQDREQYCEVREVSVAASGGVTIRDNPNGSIQVTGSGRDDVMIRARVVGSAPTMDAARALASQVEVRADGGRITTNGPRSVRNQSWSVSFRVEAPTTVDLDLETANGSIQVTGVSGRIRTESANGSLQLAGVGGDVVGRTSNGSVRVELSGETWQGTGLDLRSSNGSVAIDMPDDYNARLVASTSNGGLSVEGVDVPRQRGRSRSIDTALGAGGATIRVETSNGSVRVRHGGGDDGYDR